MENKPNITLVAFVVLGSLSAVVIYHFWTYLVALLAMCGAYHVLGLRRK